MADYGAFHEGGCHCGAVRYRFGGEPVASVICNCPSCRGVSGAASVAFIMVPEATYALQSGVPAVYESSAGVRREHCAVCGTALTFRADYIEGMVDITAASLHDPEAFPPTAHINDRHAIGWSRSQDGLPRFPEFPPQARGATSNLVIPAKAGIHVG
ncbi:MAG: GFA family protein [Pacificimonas sp.]|jgi:hypothetical protein|nr:GFA family protein [Pacificimonas sp.]